MAHRLSSCGSWAQQLWLVGSRAQAQQLWHTGLVAPRHVGSSQNRARTRVPCIGGWILNLCATREVPRGGYFYIDNFFLLEFSFFWKLQAPLPFLICAVCLLFSFTWQLLWEHQVPDQEPGTQNNWRGLLKVRGHRVVYLWMNRVTEYLSVWKSVLVWPSRRCRQRGRSPRVCACTCVCVWCVCSVYKGSIASKSHPSPRE